MDFDISNFQTKLKDFIERSQDDLTNLKKNLQMYNPHKDKVSQPYREKMERLKRNINFVISSSQTLFVCSYSFVFLKLVLFNHYRKFNPLIKFSLFSFYCLTIEPLTLASCKLTAYFILCFFLAYLGTTIYMRTKSFQDISSGVLQSSWDPNIN